MLFQKIAATSVHITIAVVASVLIAASPATAQSVTTLKTFPSPGGVRTYAPIIQALDGNFYGTTIAGGTADSGTIFKMTPAGVVTVMHNFTGVDPDGSGTNVDGIAPRGGLIQATDGNFYGTTSLGGFWTGGTVFRMTPDGTMTTLYSFNGGNDGSTPYGSLVQANDGNLYGTTITDGGETGLPGGQYLGFGTIFRVTLAGQFTHMHAFTGPNASGGFFAIGALIQASDGALYGTTNEGGSANLGVVFKMTLGGQYTVIHNFQGGDNDGSHPWATLVQGQDGALYGTTAEGGSQPYGFGLIYKITTGGTFSIVHRFEFAQLMNLPLSGLRLHSDGNFYGTTFYAGFAATGTVYRMTPQGVVTLIHTFALPEGTNPYALLTQGNDGALYGTTFAGGTNGAGAVFKITTGGTFTNLHSFLGSSDGARPHAPLIRGSDGAFYGTTRIGGPANKGAIFKMTPTGGVTILHTFNDNGDGFGIPSIHNEFAGLVQGTDGQFYGGYGTTLFKITSTGTLTVLHTLDNATEGNTPSTLIQASDGNFYGTTRWGGSAIRGTVFRMTPAGTVTVLHVFTEGIIDFLDVYHLHPYAYAPLVETGGTLFGTAYYGGTTGDGFAFSVTLGGTYTLLHNFNGPTQGALPLAPLVVGNDGQLYGSTRKESTNGKGAVFKMTTGGSVSMVHVFAGGAADGAEPAGGLLLAPNGLFYGTTAEGGSANMGTIFSMTSAGTVTVLHTFTGTNGVWPYAGLLRTPTGSFYGTVTFGGPTFVGITQEFGPFLEQPTGMGALFKMSFVTPFTDDPLAAQSTVIKAAHITELRARINAVRTAFALGAFSYSEAIAAGVTIKAQHVLEMRTAIVQAYNAAGIQPPTFSSLTVGTVVMAAHITELRNVVKALE